MIGQTGAKELLWHLPDDFKHFKNLTTGKSIIMGRTTFESIGRPLPNRTNIILTTQPGYSVEGAVVVHTADEALVEASKQHPQEIMIIGGEQIYQLFLPMSQRLYLTEIDAEIDGDVCFPIYDRSQWHEASREHHAVDDKHRYAFDFVTFERNHSQSA